MALYNIPDLDLNTNVCEFTKSLKSLEVKTFHKSVSFINYLPYGRNQNRNFKSVLEEKRGTCSSKHALLAKIALNHDCPINLYLGFFEMNAINNPEVAEVLSKNGLKYILEGHCYLGYKKNRVDITFSKRSTLSFSILEEMTIKPIDI